MFRKQGASVTKRYKIIIVVLSVLIILSATAGFIFRDFIFAKNKVFPKTGTSIHLVYTPPFQVKNTKNQFYIRKVQNLIENAEKEVVEKEHGKKGWKFRGSITVDEKHYKLYLAGNELQVGDTVYKIKDDNFTEKFKEIFDKIKNPT